MSLDSIVNITLTLQATAPSQTGFGTLLLAAYHTAYLDRVRTYKSHAAVVTDFGATHVISQAAEKVFSQRPRPKQLKIGRRALPFTKGWTFTPTATTVGLVYTLTFTDNSGDEETASYTVQSGDAVADIVDGLVAAVAAFTLVDVTATDDTTHMSVDADAAGTSFAITDISPELTVKDVTTEPGIATDLAAIQAADNDWYGLVLDSQGQDEVEAAAAWVEANKKLFVCDSADGDLKGSGSGDIASTFKSTAYARSHCKYHHEIGSFLAAGIMAKMLPKQPGAETWEYKTVAGVAVTPRTHLTDTHKTNLEGKYAGYYIELAGVNVTIGSKVGAATFIDLTRGSDWFVARLQERIYGLFVNNDKIPFTNPGIAAVKAEIYAQAAIGKKRGVFDPEYETVVEAPDVSEVSLEDRANRHLPDVSVSERFSGAIHSVDLNVTISV